MPILLMHLLKSHDGSLTSLTEILGDHHREEEEGSRRVPQDHPQVVEEEAEEAAVGEEEEHSHYPGMHLPNLLKNF